MTLKSDSKVTLGAKPECGNPKLRFDGKTYRCSKCGYEYR